MLLTVVAYPCVLKPLRSGLEHLWAIWSTRVFWRQRLWGLHWIALGACVIFWVSSTLIAWGGGEVPLLGWITSAYVSVFVSTRTNWRVFREPKDEKQRLSAAMLLLQFAVIIALNTVMIAVMLAKGYWFTPADARIATVAIGGTVLFFVMSRPISKAWALAGYAISQKSAPQAVQAWVIFTTPAMLSAWAFPFLFLQGTSRLVLSIDSFWSERKAARAEGGKMLIRGNNPLAQLAAASLDWLTVMANSIGAVLRV